MPLADGILVNETDSENLWLYRAIANWKCPGRTYLNWLLSLP